MADVMCCHDNNNPQVMPTGCGPVEVLKNNEWGKRGLTSHTEKQFTDRSCRTTKCTYAISRLDKVASECIRIRSRQTRLYAKHEYSRKNENGLNKKWIQI